MIRSAYSERLRVQLHMAEGEVTRTQQHFKEACDINNIVARFDKTGLVHHLAGGVPRYADVSQVPDFKTAMDQITMVGQYFEQLPGELREHFSGPADFMDRANDPDTRALFASHKIPADAPPFWVPPETPTPAPAEPSGDASPPEGSEGADKGL